MSVSPIFVLSDTFERILSFLDLTDIPQAALVCKHWNNFIKDNALIWRTISEKEGIPLVDGRGRNRREDFLDSSIQ